MIERDFYKELEGQDVIIEIDDGSVLSARYMVIDADDTDGDEDDIQLMEYDIIHSDNKIIHAIREAHQILGLAPSEIISIKPAA